MEKERKKEKEKCGAVEERREEKKKEKEREEKERKRKRKKRKRERKKKKKKKNRRENGLIGWIQGGMGYPVALQTMENANTRLVLPIVSCVHGCATAGGGDESHSFNFSSSQYELTIERTICKTHKNNTIQYKYKYKYKEYNDDGTIIHSVLCFVLFFFFYLPSCTRYSTHNQDEEEHDRSILETIGYRWMGGWMDVPDGLLTTTHNGS